MPVHYMIIILRLESNRHLFVDVVLLMRQKTHFFLYSPLYAVPRGNSLSGAARIVSNVHWLRFSDSQKVNLLLFGFSCLSNDTNVKFFSHVQQFIIDSKHIVLFCFVFFVSS